MTLDADLGFLYDSLDVSYRWRLGFRAPLTFVVVFGGSDDGGSGRTAFVTCKDPKALEIAVRLSVGPLFALTFCSNGFLRDILWIIQDTTS